MKKLIFAISMSLAATAAFAEDSILTLNYGANPEILEKVPVAPSATSLVADRTSNLALLGRASRRKTPFMIYVGQLFGDSSSFVKADSAGNPSGALALESLDKMKSMAFFMSFRFPLKPEEIKDSFVQSLLAQPGNIDPNGPGLKEVLGAVVAGGTVHSGDTISFVGEKVGDAEVITFQESFQGKPSVAQQIPAPLGTIKNLMSIWLGKTPDGGLKSFQQQLLTGK